MRTGVNPEKLKINKLTYHKHRIIIPVYIPNLKEDYYKNAFEVVQKCIDSLIKTTNTKQTAITIIDNNCTEIISNFFKELLKQSKVEKLVKYSENKGKVYPVLSEIKASYEDYITITDADVFFIDHWESNVFKVFNNFSKAAFVSPLPCPSNYKYLNRPLLINKFFSLKLKKIIEKKNFDLYEQGVNPKENYFQGKIWNWKDKQYMIANKNTEACVGATHFVFTIKKDFLNLNNLKGPDFVFRNGDEKKYLEKFIEENGGYRLSTIDTYAYHMGNNIDIWIDRYLHKSEQLKVDIKNVRKKPHITKLNFLFIKVLFKMLSKTTYRN